MYIVDARLSNSWQGQDSDSDSDSDSGRVTRDLWEMEALKEVTQNGTTAFVLQYRPPDEKPSETRLSPLSSAHSMTIRARGVEENYTRHATLCSRDDRSWETGISSFSHNRGSNKGISGGQRPERRTYATWHCPCQSILTRHGLCSRDERSLETWLNSFRYNHRSNNSVDGGQRPERRTCSTYMALFLSKNVNTAAMI